MQCNRKCLLAAISPSPGSLETLLTAHALARSSGSELVLLQSLELNICGEERGINRQDFLRDLMLDAEKRLTQRAGSLCGDLTFTVIIREGPPSTAILRTAADCGANAIVMGSRHSDGKSWFRRNNFRVVLRDAKIPIYTVLSHEESDSVINSITFPPNIVLPPTAVQIVRASHPSVLPAST